MARRTHLDTGAGTVACGSHSSWLSRGKPLFNLPKSKTPKAVNCAGCRRTWRFERTCDAENQRNFARG